MHAGHTVIAAHRSETADRAMPPWTRVEASVDVVCRLHQRINDVYDVTKIDVVVVGIFHQVGRHPSICISSARDCTTQVAPETSINGCEWHLKWMTRQTAHSAEAGLSLNGSRNPLAPSHGCIDQEPQCMQRWEVYCMVPVLGTVQFGNGDMAE